MATIEQLNALMDRRRAAPVQPAPPSADLTGTFVVILGLCGGFALWI